MKTKQLNIFLVAKDHLISEHYRQYLKIQGYQNVSAFDNEIECINHLEDQPDIVFVGNVVNPAGGMDVLRSIKTFDPAINVILLPGAEYADALRSSRKADYILDYLTSVLDRVNVVRKFLKTDARLVY